MRFTVDPWDPGYGVPVDIDPGERSAADVDVGCEAQAGDWAPRSAPPGVAEPSVIRFVDGVRRVEARLWIDAGGGSVVPGLCASYAAGVVVCDGKAEVVDVEVGRAAFTPFAGAADISTRFGVYAARIAAESSGDALVLALQADMAGCERVVSERARRDGVDDLLVVDGPLRGRQHLPRSIGFVKTHDVSYLPPELDSVVAALAAGQRTPVFCIAGRFPRWSWYLRLADVAGSPWAAVVRCEAPATTELGEAVRLADLTAAVLPRFGSEPHKDSRAPQNLYPIAGLERVLKRRLGDQRLLYRELRRAGISTAAISNLVV